MKFEFIGNACGVFHGDEGTRLLCDPWIENGVFEGSWCHYPPLKSKVEDFSDVDALYISHIHPDHYDARHFNFRLDIPIVVLDHKANFLINNLERAGFTNLIRIRDDATVSFREFDLTVYAPFAKHHFHHANVGNLIDSALVVKGGGKVALNANDNTPTVDACKMLKDKFGHIDLAMINYNAAGPYPACFQNLSDDEKLKENERILMRNYDYMASLVNELKPSFVLPFAGAYVLGGKFHYKNPHLGTSTWDRCARYIENKVPHDTKVICLREHDCFDLASGCSDKPYEPIDEEHMWNYIEKEISGIKYDYELDDSPDANELIEDVAKASKLMLERMKRFGISVDTSVFVDIFGKHLEVFTPETQTKQTMTCTLDSRLFRRILDRKSHWNNAEIGCHIEFVRDPNVYEPDLHTALQFLHL